MTKNKARDRQNAANGKSNSRANSRIEQKHNSAETEKKSANQSKAFPSTGLIWMAI
ncbi:hypothetical protein [Pseudomonas saudimassiliensis]|uniref:hypothetical protein n=1 Tax=Pseudomonas saudimassiliensis TaxID=1461581 RepID=UPI000AE6E1DF|nr:hypothetical protein [Pseudomonas saudimassiliensis]